jgi:hypothetical protein
MFHNTKIEIFPSPEGVPLKSIYADVQPYLSTVTFDYGVSLEISIRVFCDVDESISDQVYFKIDGFYYKVLSVKAWKNHMEIFLYRCKRQVG